MDVLAVILSVVLIFLAALHFYWSIFGIKEPEAVLPTKLENNATFSAGKFGAALVGIILLLFAFVFINKVVLFLEYYWLRYISFGIGVIFILRAFGDFKYVGFFKTAKNSKFSALDTKFYSPLCLLMGLLVIVVELFG